MRICIYSFSTTALFFRALIDRCQAERDDIEWCVVFPQGDFRYVMADVIPPERTCYLYADFRSHYDAIDEAAIGRGLEAGEGLVTALMKDKGGYRFLDKAEQLRRAAAIHAIYDTFVRRLQPDVMLFPDVEAVDGFVLQNVCKAAGIEILYAVSERLLGRSFFARDSYDTLPHWFGDYTDDDIREAKRVIACFRRRQNPFPDAARQVPMPPMRSLFWRVVVNGWNRWRHEGLHVSQETVVMRVRRNFRLFADRMRVRWFDLTATRYFDKTSLDQLPARFVFYAFHVTPESSINGLEPYYVDQLRVVDALLLSLPKGMQLVVKEHPAMRGWRPLSVYRELCRRPGLVLLHPMIDSRPLVERASLIATVTGTIGLESYLLGKPCLLFGRVFFRHLCISATPIAELRDHLNAALANYVAPTEAEREIAVAKLINIGGEFEISNPYHFPITLEPNRIAAARRLLLRYLRKLKEAAA